ncbi:MAG: hypothetical protein FWH05_06930 [Oscillospiraceae bacterium]|nr:hypothetical protein [Oscillospiraceae bacterium]
MKTEISTKRSEADREFLDSILPPGYITLFNGISDTITQLETMILNLKNYHATAEEQYLTVDS